MERETRNCIQRATQDARELLEREYAEQLEGTFDIRLDGTIVKEPGKHLNVDQRMLRIKLVEAVEHRKTGGLKADEAVAAYLREAAFTTLNRFVALKMLEARNLLQECISQGEQSSGFKEFTGLAPGLTQLSDHGYRLYIESLFDEIGREVRVLFDRLDPASLLWPRRPMLNSFLDILNATDLVEIWKEDETIGWIYQFFNSDEERRQMHSESQAPRDSRELAVRNQFFTPRYVVEFLTDNTLGRIWYEMCKGQTSLTKRCGYLIRRPAEIFLYADEETIEETKETDCGTTQEELIEKPVYIPHRPKKDPRNIKVLDPACGSGHFLLYCFDLLQAIYEEAYEDPDLGEVLKKDYPVPGDFCKMVPSLILKHNLHGIDIDLRATQIAALALWLRCQRAYQAMGLNNEERPKIKRSNLVTAEPMPDEEDMRREFATGLKPKVLGQLINLVFEKMKLAGEAGLLLKVEEKIKDAVSEARKEWMEVSKLDQQLLFPSMSDLRPKKQKSRFDLNDITDELFWEQAEDRILEALKKYAEKAESDRSTRRRLFAQDAGRGFAFIDTCRRRYDVVLMNPPFGEPSAGTKTCISTEWPREKGDLSCCFVSSAMRIITSDGFLGVLMTRTPYFLSSFGKWRKEVVFDSDGLTLFADFGLGVLDAMVETCACVFGPNFVRDSRA
jgi:hypothetical protein